MPGFLDKMFRSKECPVHYVFYIQILHCRIMSNTIFFGQIGNGKCVDNALIFKMSYRTSISVEINWS